MEPDNGATALVVATETRMVVRVFPAARPDRTVAKVEDVAKRGKSSLWMFEVKRPVWLSYRMWLLVTTALL